jgi:hypothetical protein
LWPSISSRQRADAALVALALAALVLGLGVCPLWLLLLVVHRPPLQLAGRAANAALGAAPRALGGWRPLATTAFAVRSTPTLCSLLATSMLTAVGS